MRVRPTIKKLPSMMRCLAKPFVMVGTISATAVTAGNLFDVNGKLPSHLSADVLRSQLPLDMEVLQNVGGQSLGGFGLHKDAIRRVLDQSGLNANVAVVEVPQVRLPSGSSNFLDASRSLWTSNGSGTATHRVINDLKFQVQGVSICGAAMRTVQEANGDTVLVGSIPQIFQTTVVAEGDWPDVSEAARRSIQTIATHQNFDPTTAIVTNLSKCYYNLQGYLEPAWEFVVRFQAYQYQAFATEHKVYEASPRHLDLVTATVQAYDPNITTGVLKNYTINVSGDGTLTNDFFKTAVYSGAARVTSSSQQFSYSGANTASAEASTFAYANVHYDFVSARGYSWVGPKPLTINVHATIRSNVNNALYTPFDGTSGPNIYVGEGDGITLKNLAYDTDVVSHEFGHHVIYQSITKIGGEALILHEGLADFLSFSRTNDACLGESICPSGSRMCVSTSSKCLRTADNTLAYKDNTYQAYANASSAHQQGQLISGFLWDLRKRNLIPGDRLTEMVIDAIAYLPSDASIKNFVAAFYYVDEKNGQTYREAINTVAEGRGLSPASLGIDLSNLKVTASSSSANSGSFNRESKSGGKGILACGVIGGAQAGSSTGLAAILMLLVPLVLLVGNHGTRVRVPARVKNQRKN